MTTASARLYRVLGKLENRRARLVVIAAALLLTSPALVAGFALDDFILRAQLENVASPEGAGAGALDLFVFADGDRARNLALIDRGAGLPWWTHPEAKGAFFRPLTSVTHWLDSVLWPGVAWLQLAHNLVWFAAVLFAARLVYRRLGGTAWVAGVALLVFALDETHGSVVGWIANRNSLIATTCGLLALAAHDRARREGRWSSAVLAALALAAGLLSTEFAAGVLAYLLAYAVFVDESPWPKRLLSLSPYAGIVVVWRVIYSLRGYGAHGLGSYIDPVGDPLRFLSVLPSRMATLIASQLGGPPADFGPLFPPSLEPVLMAQAVFGLLVAAWLIWPVLRSDRRMRFWALGAVLAAVPVSATWASDRLLWFVGLGAAPLIAATIGAGLKTGLWALGHRFRGVVVGAFAFAHLLVAPLQLPMRTQSMGNLGKQLAAADASLPADPVVAERTVVILDPPVSLFASYLPVRRAVLGQPAPKHLYWLAPRTSELEITRMGLQRLRVRAEEGFLSSIFERHYRDPMYRMPVGHRVELSEMTVEVVELMPDGRPRVCDFVFREPLESERYQFFEWNQGGFRPHVLMAPGQSVRRSPVYLVDLLFAAP